VITFTTAAFGFFDALFIDLDNNSYF